MRRFRFRLDPLLEKLRREEELLGARLADLDSEIAGLGALAERHRAEVAALEEQLPKGWLRSPTAPRTVLGELELCRRQRSGIARIQIRQAELQVEKDQLQIERLEAARERRRLELLRERAWRSHIDRARRAEQAALDELAVLGHARARLIGNGPGC